MYPIRENPTLLRQHALAIWHAGLAAVRSDDLVRRAVAEELALPIRMLCADARRILVFGAGKAGAVMSAGLEEALAEGLERMEGLVNVPAGTARPLRAIDLHVGRPAATNQPTAEGIEGARRILELARSAGPEDVGICLLSGGGSALLPAPVEGVTLEEKQRLTLLLHACGATINEMNAVRKHLSQIKGGQLAREFRGKALISLIISDVVGDPLDVIASGPTAPDPTTFNDALAVLRKYQLLLQVPPGIRDYLEQGTACKKPETPKQLPPTVHNIIIGNNDRALAAAEFAAANLGYRVTNMGSHIEGESRAVGNLLAIAAQSIRSSNQPPACLLCGGETTVTLTAEHGLGGRNQELVLAAGAGLGRTGLQNVAILSAGTDGEDGPTDAAGAVADEEVWRKAEELGLHASEFLERHDAYRFFEAVGGLIKTGLTQTNVMDLRVVLIV